jgi:hypothetical protein
MIGSALNRPHILSLPISDYFPPVLAIRCLTHLTHGIHEVPMQMLLPVLCLCTILFACGEDPPAPATPVSPPARAIHINGNALDAGELATLVQLETAAGTRLPDGKYWYDPVCGAFGAWGGPVLVIIPAGLKLGGPVPANASGGGTGIFINGRELHAFDVLYLQHLLGPIQPGRYFTDAFGNAGAEGGPVLVNLYVAAQQRGGFSSYSANANTGTRSSISSEGVSFTNSTGKTISWYPGLGSSVSP